MFGKSEIKRLRGELIKSHQVVENQRNLVEAMQSAVKKSCVLYDVSKSGRVLTLRFRVGDGKTFEIETFAEMGVDVEAIKKQAGLS